ncbi:MAG: ATP-binding cassette domain-containing protein [Tannerella sp.]|jgi:ABC-2 type transport system ATP-binding protein|nr:ATP-binding cassette domain-containing protein [Tannerella sp.]
MSKLKLKIEIQRYARKTVLQNIHQEYTKGLIHGFLGENGSGKTTLFNCMSGILSFTGSLFFSETDNFGYLPTELFMFPMITGNEFLHFFVAAKDQKMKKPELQQLNELFELPLNEYADQYSTGMLKKLYLLGLLLQHNEILLLDEPFNGLDFKLVALVTALLSHFREKGGTVFVASHDIEHLFSFSDTLSVLQNRNLSHYPDKESFNRLKTEIIEEAKRKVGILPFV